MPQVAAPRRTQPDHRAAWAACTARTKTRRKLQSAAKIAATSVGAAMVLGGVALTQGNPPVAAAGLAPRLFQQPPVIASAGYDIGRQFAVPANRDGAPVLAVAPPDPIVAPPAPRLTAADPQRLSLDQPRALQIAPVMGQIATTARPAAPVAKASRGPDGAVPARPAVPAAFNPFICTACESALPAFEGVTFTVQTVDVESAAASELLRALGASKVDLRLSSFSLPRSEVRYYRAQDTESAGILASRYDADLVDLTWVQPEDSPAKIEIILAGPTD